MNHYFVTFVNTLGETVGHPYLPNDSELHLPRISEFVLLYLEAGSPPVFWKVEDVVHCYEPMPFQSVHVHRIYIVVGRRSENPFSVGLTKAISPHQTVTSAND